MLPMTITCWPSRSFFLFSFFFCFIFLCLQKLYIHHHLWEKLFFVHLHSYTRQTFSVYTRIKNSFSLYQHGLYKNFIPVQRFLFRFSTYTRCLYKNFFIYTRCSHTRISFHTLFTHTQNLSIHFLHIKTLFFSLYIDMTFVHNVSFFFLFLALSWFLFVLFLERRS